MGTAPLGTMRQITLISAEDLSLTHLILLPKDQVVLSFLAFYNPKLISVGLFELQGTSQSEWGWLYSGPLCAIDLFLKPIKTDIFLYIFSSRSINAGSYNSPHHLSFFYFSDNGSKQK